MCVSKGAPKKPAYGPCNERHGLVWNSPLYTNTQTYSGTTATTSDGVFWDDFTSHASASSGTWTIV